MKRFLLLLTLLGCLALLPSANAAAPPLVVILLPGTSLGDWQSANAPNLHRLMRAGALAVMNTRTAHRAGEHSRETPQSALLTLAAGARAAGTGAAESFTSASSQAPEMMLRSDALFKRRTGIKPQPSQSVCLNWPAVLSANRNPGYDLRLGSLPDALAAHGVAAASGGGSAADWIAAGNEGIVRRTTKLQAAPGVCLIWDAGPDIVSADDMIGTAAAQIAEHKGRLIVLSPYASDADYALSQRLTPVLVWGSDVPAGLLFSPSTRRPGLVTNTDFAPAVAEYFAIGRMDFSPLPFGFAWSARASPNSLKTVERLNSQSVQQAQGMRLLPYLAITLGAWILAATLLAHQRQIAGFWTLLPIAALIAALFSVSLATFGEIALGAAALTLTLSRFLGSGQALTILTATAVLALTADMVMGNPMMHRGLLGYSAIEGARYYGIGNEAMGLLLGSALVAAARFWSERTSRRQWFLASTMAGLILLLASAGAKAGGVLVSTAVFGVFLYTVSGRRWTVRTVAALSAVVIAGMAVTALGDAFLSVKGHSHIGEAVQRIASGGPSEALDIIRRKLSVEGRLAYHSTWAALLWGGIICTAHLWKRLPAAAPASQALRLAGAVGIALCLVLNDAGVVAAAIFVVMLWSDAINQKQNLPATGNSVAGRRGG